MSNKKIYSFKASGNGCRASGRICAENMDEATKQVLENLSGYGQMNVNITELKNQAKALKEWENKGKSSSSKPYDETM